MTSILTPLASPATTVAASHDAPPAPLGAPFASPAAPLALGAALAVAALGDTLLRANGLGLNLVVLVAALLAAGAWLARRTGQRLTVGAVLLAALALVVAAAVAWRDAPLLVALDVLALLTVLCALVPMVRDGHTLAIERAGPVHYVAGAALTGLRVAAGGPRLAAGAVAASPVSRGLAARGLGSVARGSLLALPVLLVFAGLLMSADRAFERLLERLVAWDGGTLVSHVVVITLLAWIAGGALFAALLDRPAPHDPARPDALATIGARLRARLCAAGVGAREMVVVLALVDLLFLGFGALQLRWFFGGAGSLQAAGLTVAEYARSGFFELVTVAALVLPLLLVTHAVASEPAERGALSPGDEAPVVAHTPRGYRIAAGLMIALVGLLLVSAGDRMALYLDAFGLTRDRFHASAFMAWLGAVFAWAAVTLLRGRVAQFALGTLVSAWAMVLALHVVNPDARIAGVNTARALAGREFDAAYLRTLDLDAAPVLAARVPALLARMQDPAMRCVLRAALHDMARRADAPGDWRRWRWSRARAAAVLPAWARGPAPVCGAAAGVSRAPA
ncbi:MAG: DUF4173 domain-containing protein [Gemmatimonadaceae bacterium]|jgi:hypothetical protein|nr:DUF4173 domain-containing protein [Gemmatimonadaceae bacterium]